MMIPSFGAQLPSPHPMELEGLIQDLKDLKQSKPYVQPPRKNKRLQRYIQFQEENGQTLNSSAKGKVRPKREGMFQNISFCIPMIDPPNDPSPEALAVLARGIHSQGGKITDFSYEMQNKQVNYVLVDHRSEISYIRNTLRGKVIYLSIVDYRWVENSLRKFARLDISEYNLEKEYCKKEEERPKIHPSESAEGPSANHLILSIEEGPRQHRDGCPVSNDEKAKPEEQEKQREQEELEKQGEQVKQGQQEKQEKQEGQGDQGEKSKELSEVNSSQTDIMEERDSLTNFRDQQSLQGYETIPDNNSFEEDHHQFNRSVIFQGQSIQEDRGQTTRQRQGASDEDNLSQSEQTEKIDSDDDKERNSALPLYYRKEKQPISTPEKKPRKESPEEEEEKAKQSGGRRKQKLSLGSHQFSINNQIVEQLKKMQQFYQSVGNRKSFAYLRAIACIKNYGKEIRSASELKNIDGLGKDTIEKVKEFLRTGTIKKIDQTVNKQSAIPHKQLLRIYGIGPSTALQFYHKGIRTIKDLQRHSEFLTKSQKIGLKYYLDFEQRIPREKVTKMLELVRQTLFYLVRSDAKHDVEAVGSYRRGKATCGDIDILITRKDGYVEKSLLQHLLQQLEKRKFITDHITFPKPFDGRSSVNYMGVCQFQGGLHHRIDIKHYPPDQYAYALLYFTGSDLFNREMRMHASQLGMVLGDHEIKYKVKLGNPSRLKDKIKIVTCYTQQDIFKMLEMDYRSPAQRQL